MFVKRSRYCSNLSTHTEVIALQLKFVIGETFYINNNTSQGYKREKFPRDKIEITITP